MPELPPPAARVADFPGELAAFLDELNRDPPAGDEPLVLRRRLRALREDAGDQIAVLRAQVAAVERELDAVRAELAEAKTDLAGIRGSWAWPLACRFSMTATALKRIVGRR